MIKNWKEKEKIEKKNKEKKLKKLKKKRDKKVQIEKGNRTPYENWKK